MSDHNMNDSGWRKRQIALDIKAENARELGLDYEPDKTITEMATEAGLIGKPIFRDGLERFAELVRADERESAISAIQNIERRCGWITRVDAINAIRARGQA